MAWLLAFILAGGGLIVPHAAWSADEPVVVNPDTGLAISGFDPLAYFTVHKAELGRADLELRLDGAIWQFRNVGNRDAFAAHPQVYMPRFGGYDPVAVARGDMVPGNPEIWAMVGQRVYLFYDNAARTTFLNDPGRLIVTAERKWPEITKAGGH